MNAHRLRPLTTALAAAGLACMLVASGNAAAAPKKKTAGDAVTDRKSVV